MYGLVGVARAFGMVGHGCATKCEKSEKEGKDCTLSSILAQNMKDKAKFS